MADAALVQEDCQQSVKDFASEHPYLRLERRGSWCLPPEAGNANSDDEDDDLSASQPTDQEAADPEAHAGSASMGAAAAVAGSTDSASASLGPGTALASRETQWHVKVFADDYFDKRHCTESGELKARRPTPHIKASKLLAGLKKVEGSWVFEQPINGWPGITNLVLRSLTHCKKTFGFSQVTHIWRAQDGNELPKASEIPHGTRANFHAPVWTAVGWAPHSFGFVWWFSDRHGAPRVHFGEHMLKQLEADPCDIAFAHATELHTFAHRYPVEKETMQDRQTWHTGVLIEWSHGRFTTLIELAWRNGCGGYGGKSNWCEDKLSKETAIAAAMGPAFVKPWNEHRTEIRMIDMPSKNKAEFEAYLNKYSNKVGLPLCEQRFVDPEVYASGRVRLRRCTSVDLAGFLLNYASRVLVYDKFLANCQTFAADLFGFLSGTPGIKPYGEISQLRYKQHSRAFMYTADYSKYVATNDST
eukprot:CAMPEP_0115485536 /NCGR_PEP_ID=MMETSP0271-20121206/59969_1 /TAXON_ID=71861 /ORGANISM="Scrippsiella trochoidea, Strain CCMP3099" /LENGTH=472 /DNA_ID=CAMNT_0002913515 /DNA_START=79 /DNA_END=1497 /DNA_ORIENTATION=-